MFLGPIVRKCDQLFVLKGRSLQETTAGPSLASFSSSFSCSRLETSPQGPTGKEDEGRLREGLLCRNQRRHSSLTVDPSEKEQRIYMSGTYDRE